MKRISVVDLMLLGTVLLWALNLTVTRYVVSHGFQPLAYGTSRYLTATALFFGFTWRRERSLLGDLLAVATAAGWACYSVVIAPLMRRYSPFRISAVVLALGWVPLALVSISQLSRQSLAGFGWTMALAFAFAVLGPLFLTNILWFTAIGRVGPSRASLFANLEPFFAVLFAVVLLSERLTGWELAGGAAIAVGIGLERLGQRGVAEPVVVVGE